MLISFPKKTRRSSSAPTAPSATSARTSPITCGSSGCWAAISDIASSTAIPRARLLDFNPTTERREEPSALRRCRRNLQRDRCAPVRSAEHRIEALRGLGHGEAADHYTHFSYEMVVLTPRCAAELGYNLTEEEKARPYIEVSGRKGFGVKADDLLDQLIASAKKEVDSRHPQLSEPERLGIATQIAIGALRYFMLKYTKQSVIAFDFKDALSFEGETGPYAQYAVVRASSIFRKAGLEPDDFPLNLAQSDLAVLSPDRTPMKSGSFGLPPRRLLRWSSNALRPRNQPISPSMSSSWPSSSTPSTIAIPFSPRPMRSENSSCSPPSL